MRLLPNAGTQELMQTQNPLVHIHTSPPLCVLTSLLCSLSFYFSHLPSFFLPFSLSFPSSFLPSLTTFHLLLYSVFPLLRFPSFSALRNMALALQSEPPNEEIVPLWRSTITCPFNSAHVFKNAHRHSAHTHVCYSAVWKRGYDLHLGQGCSIVRVLPGVQYCFYSSYSQ